MFDPNLHHRRSIRMRGYDYSRAGAYFVTICTQGRLSHFGEVVSPEGAEPYVKTNFVGHGFCNAWLKMPRKFPKLELDEWILMPNHFHALVSWEHDSVNELRDIIGAWKSWTTMGYCRRVHNSGWPAFEKRFWQRNYWEHIVRNEQELENIRRYIIDNPANWAGDIHHPTRPDASNTTPSTWDEM